jgi:hypothetical protein
MADSGSSIVTKRVKTPLPEGVFHYTFGKAKIIKHLLPHLTPISIICLKRADPRLSKQIDQYADELELTPRHVVKKRLREMGLPAISIVGSLGSDSDSSYLAGGFVLQVLIREEWENSDIDVVTLGREKTYTITHNQWQTIMEKPYVPASELFRCLAFGLLKLEERWAHARYQFGDEAEGSPELWADAAPGWTYYGSQDRYNFLPILARRVLMRDMTETLKEVKIDDIIASADTYRSKWDYIVNTFDYSCCKVAFDGDRFLIHNVDHVATKIAEDTFNGPLCPNGSMSAEVCYGVTRKSDHPKIVMVDGASFPLVKIHKQFVSHSVNSLTKKHVKRVLKYEKRGFCVVIKTSYWDQLKAGIIQPHLMNPTRKRDYRGVLKE